MINFEEIYWYASRANAAYLTPEDIRQQLPNVHTIDTVDSIEVQYFIEDVPDKNAQLVAVRGTNNLTNVKDDAEFIKNKCEKLGIYVHQGFDENAKAIYDTIKQKLDPEKSLLLTGHSLGGAISTLLMMYFHVDNYTIGKSINFGQPKVTNAKGVDKYCHLPLIRVVNEEDLVPLVPPVNLLDVVHGAYQHLGEKLLLLNDRKYSLLDKDEAEDRSIGNFWRNMGHHSLYDHMMEDYLKNILDNMQGATEVPYTDRHEYS